MKYHWGEWSLDRDAGLLKRQGRPVDASRKVMECIGHLIGHRDRVVGYDELIRKVWGHDNVSNHQLSQVILSARRLLGDDGQNQRLIRTASGLGYQWVGMLDDAPAAPSAPASSSDPMPSQTASPPHAGVVPIPAPTPPPEPRHDSGEARDPQAQPPEQGRMPAGPDAPAAAGRANGFRLALTVVLLLCVAVYAWRRGADDGASTPGREAMPAGAASIGALEIAMRAGDFDAVREGLTALPPSMAESPDATLIAMRLDFHRGRFERARDKLDAQLALARGAEDPIWQAKLLVFESMLKGRQGATASERETSIQAALDLLEPLGEAAAPEVLADALRGRSAVQLLQGRHEAALRDLNSSGQIYERIGDARSAIAVRTDRARIWMRTGRLEDALRTMRSVADDYQARSDKIGQVGSFNTMARIQMELLRWEDAVQTSDRALAVLRETPVIERRDRALQLRAQAMTRLGRLRQARALLEEVGTLQGDEASSMIAVLYLLEAGRTASALKASAVAFWEGDRDDPDDILLDTREGALLAWMIAAQRIADAGAAMPTPSPAQVNALRNPMSIAGTIAGARWAMSQGDDARAEPLLREALDEARRKGMRYHLVLASEPMLDLLLRQGRTADARRLLEDVRAFDRERTDQDYAFTVQRWRLAVATGDNRATETLGEKLRALAGERHIPGSAWEPERPR